MSEQKYARTGWIDICKAIAIYFMVLAHTGVSTNVSIWIHAFHMPVFFLLSGYCFNEVKNSNIFKLIKKRFCTLIIPYFIFGVSLFLFWDLALFVLHRKSEMRSISNLLSSILWNNADASTFGVIQWFLPCLFFAEIIFAILLKLVRNKPLYVAILLIGLSLIGYIISKVLSFRLPLALDCSFMATFFFGIGWLASKSKVSNVVDFINKHRLISVVAVVVLAVADVPLIFLCGAVNMRTVSYENYFLFVLNALVYSLVLVVLSVIADSLLKHKKTGRALKTVGANTLVVLLLNSTCIRFYEVLFGKLLDKMPATQVCIINAVVALAITIVCVLISLFVNRFCPWLLGKRKKR